MKSPNQPPEAESVDPLADVPKDVLEMVGKVGVLPVYDPELREPVFGVRSEDGGVRRFTRDELAALDAQNANDRPPEREVFVTADIQRKYGGSPTKSNVEGRVAQEAIRSVAPRPRFF